MKKNIIIYLCFFGLMFFMSTVMKAEMDEIWEYSFSYKISKGLLPYRNINMIVGPLYSLMLTLPFFILPNNLLMYEIVHCFFYAAVFMFIYKKLGKNSIFIGLLLSCSVVMIGYNMFCTMLFLIILLLLDSNFKYRNLIIGILIGVIMMTKHNIGGILALVYFFTNKDKLKSIIYILIPVIPTLLYLCVNNILYDYIDYCYLGMGSFTKNMSTDFLSIIPFTYFVYKLIKIYKNNKDVKILYILSFQIICFPILDMFHTVIGLIPILYYLFLNEYKDKNLMFSLKYFVLIGFVVSSFVIPISILKLNLDSSAIGFQMIEKDKKDRINYYSNYLDKTKSKTYLLLIDASMIRIYRNEIPDHYDEFLRGNLGSNEEKFIKSMGKDCENKNCTFILDKGYFRKKVILDQWIYEVRDYVVENYNFVEITPFDDRVYRNY